MKLSVLLALVSTSQAINIESKEKTVVKNQAKLQLEEMTKWAPNVLSVVDQLSSDVKNANDLFPVSPTSPGPKAEAVIAKA